jgi:hypothetical protein
MSQLRIGQGWDSHRLVAGRPLMLGGIAVPSELGRGRPFRRGCTPACPDRCHTRSWCTRRYRQALPAIGCPLEGCRFVHFPGRGHQPAGDRWLAACQHRRYHTAGEAAAGTTHRSIRQKVASLAGMDIDDVSVKAKTREGLDAVGRGEAVEAMAVVLVERAET